MVAGVVYLPMMDKLYAAERGGGATLNGAAIKVARTKDLSAATVLSAKPNFADKHWKNGQPPEVKRGYRPSLAYRLCLVAEGQFDAMLTLRPTWEWDIAAGDLILREAGAVTGDRAGRTSGSGRRASTKSTTFCAGISQGLSRAPLASR